MHTWFRGVVAFVALVAGGSWLVPPAAHAIQASGSIILSPSKQLQLAQNEELEVTVSVVNTSSQTPAPLLGAPATLTGPITIDLACTDCGCTQKQAGALTFVAGASAGCVAKVGEVMSCSGDSSTVTIELAGGGVALPADTTPVEIATFRLRMNAGSGPPLGIRARTGDCALTACIAPDQGCVSCSADGCTFLTPGAPGNLPCDCPHPCPNRIRFIGDLGRPDAFEVHAIIQPGPGFDPSAHPFTVSMSNASGEIFSFTLPPGSLVQQGANFRYTASGTNQTGGIARVNATARNDTPGAYRIDIVGFSAALEPATTIPVEDGNITTVWEVGGAAFSTGVQAWERRQFGWQLTQFGFCQP